MEPSTVYKDAGADIDALSQEVQTLTVEELMEEDTETPVNSNHFYVLQDNSDIEDTSEQHVEGGGSQCDEQSSQDLPPYSSTCGQGTSSFLILPRVPTSATCEGNSQVHRMQPLVDYSRSIIMTSSTYMEQLQQVAAKKEATAQLKEAKKLEAIAKKRKQQEEKLERQIQKKQRDANKAEKKRSDTYWKEVASSGWGNQLQAVMKSNVPPPLGAYKGKYCGLVPVVCIHNQRQRRFIMLRKRAAQAGHVPAGFGVA
jgi:hypothetical protein